jgi:IS1 family transposase
MQVIKLNFMLDNVDRRRIVMGMNKLPRQKRAQILSMLCEGASMRGISRVADVSINTVSKLLIDAGEACSAFHDAKVCGVTAKRVQVNEIWSFTGVRQKNAARAKAAPADAGDTWTWTAIETDTKLLISWLVGGRDGEYAMAFMDDLRSRLANCVQLTSDGHRACLEAVEGAFGAGADCVRLVKLYGAPPEGERGYSPAECIGIKKMPIEGNPDPKHISTSYVEHQNVTVRTQMRRHARPTDAFSKKLENHMHMIALYTVWYNFVKMHKSLRMTPAMAAGITDRLWLTEDIAEMVDATLPLPGPLGPCKKQISN